MRMVVSSWTGPCLSNRKPCPPIQAHHVDRYAEKNLTVFNLEEEEYIDDIPFDTGCVTSDCLYHKAVSVDFQIEDDNYVDDIPFNTECISTNCKYLKALSIEFNFEDEAYIDDMEL